VGSSSLKRVGFVWQGGREGPNVAANEMSCRRRLPMTAIRVGDAGLGMEGQ
jgi:hypothetical protein